MRSKLSAQLHGSNASDDKHDDTNGKNINSLWQSRGYGTSNEKAPTGGSGDITIFD